MLGKNEFFRLVHKLGDQDPRHRLRAVVVLAESKDPRRIGPLTRRIFDVSPEIRQRACDELKSSGFIPSVEAVESLYVHGEAARRAAVDSIRPLFLLPMPAPHHAVLMASSVGLHELFDDIAVLAATHEDKFVRRAAVEGLYQCNQEALAPSFIFPAIDLDVTVRKYAAVGLAENSMTAFAHRLRSDPDKAVRHEAGLAFAHPGEPWIVRDPLRQIMEKSESFALPMCGTVLLPTGALPQLRAFARRMLQADDAGHVAAALATLRSFGSGTRELLEQISCKDDPLVRRFLHREKVLSRVQESGGPEPIPELKGKRILVLGGDGRNKTMLERLCLAGVEVEWMSGFGNRAARAAQSKLDAVVVIWKCVSHAVAEHAPAIAERSGAPIIYARSATASAVVEAVLDAE